MVVAASRGGSEGSTEAWEMGLHTESGECSAMLETTPEQSSEPRAE